MRRAILYGPGDLQLEECEIPDELQSEEILIQTVVTALSTGTELGSYLGDPTFVPGSPGYPRALGYNNVGRVSSVGSAVDRVRVDDLVLSHAPHQSAAIVASEDVLAVLPTGLDAEEACFAYLCQLGLAALQQAGHRVGDPVVVVGLGVVGLCAVATCQATGSPVVALATSSTRAAVASALGARTLTTVDRLDTETRVRKALGDPPRTVLLAANPWSAFRTAVDVVAPNGRVCILGFPGRGQGPPDFNPFDPASFYGKQISLLASGLPPHTSTQELQTKIRQNVEQIMGWMVEGMIRLGPIVSHRFPPEQMRRAFELAARHAQVLTGVIFRWQ